MCIVRNNSSIKFINIKGEEVIDLGNDLDSSIGSTDDGLTPYKFINGFCSLPNKKYKEFYFDKNGREFREKPKNEILKK